MLICDNSYIPLPRLRPRAHRHSCSKAAFKQTTSEFFDARYFLGFLCYNASGATGLRNSAWQGAAWPSGAAQRHPAGRTAALRVVARRFDALRNADRGVSQLGAAGR